MPETSYEVQLPDGTLGVVTAMAVAPSQLPQPPPGSGLETPGIHPGKFRQSMGHLLQQSA